MDVNKIVCLQGQVNSADAAYSLGPEPKQGSGMEHANSRSGITMGANNGAVP